MTINLGRSRLIDILTSRAKAVTLCALVVATLSPLTSSVSLAQATFTAERHLNVKLGGTVSIATPGLPRGTSVLYKSLIGAGVYGTFDPHPRFGGEASVRQVYGSGIGERTYLAGPRYFRPFWRYTPYAKMLFGRGTFKFPDDIGDLSFPVVAPGAGMSYRASSALELRVDYEYQYWLGFDRKVTNFPGSLSPQVLSFGVAYVVR